VLASPSKPKDYANPIKPKDYANPIKPKDYASPSKPKNNASPTKLEDCASPAFKEAVAATTSELVCSRSISEVEPPSTPLLAQPVPDEEDFSAICEQCSVPEMRATFQELQDHCADRLYRAQEVYDRELRSVQELQDRCADRLYRAQEVYDREQCSVQEVYATIQWSVDHLPKDCELGQPNLPKIPHPEPTVEEVSPEKATQKATRKRYERAQGEDDEEAGPFEEPKARRKWPRTKMTYTAPEGPRNCVSQEDRGQAPAQYQPGPDNQPPPQSTHCKESRLQCPSCRAGCDTQESLNQHKKECEMFSRELKACISTPECSQTFKYWDKSNNGKRAYFKHLANCPVSDCKECKTRGHATSRCSKTICDLCNQQGHLDYMCPYVNCR
jgi:hypothetical protein